MINLETHFLMYLIMYNFSEIWAIYFQFKLSNQIPILLNS